MSNLSELFEILDSLRDVELALSRMYVACAQRYHDDNELWTQLHEEEEQHADLVEQLKELVESHPDQCSVGRFSLEAIATFLRGIETRTQEVGSGKIERKQALGIARDYENALLEKNFFESIATTLPDFRQIRTKLNHDTYLHRKTISDRLDSLEKPV